MNFNAWFSNLSIKKTLIAVITTALITLSLFSLGLNNYIFSHVFKESIEQDILPNQLGKIESHIREQLSTPLELSKSISQNKFLLDWAAAGEPESGQQQVIEYLKHLQQENGAFTVFWVSNSTQNYYTHNGISRKITQLDDVWFYKFINNNKPFEISFDIEKGTTKLTVFVNYKVKHQGKNIALAGFGYPVDQVSQSILTNKVGQNGYVFVTDNQGNIIIHPQLTTLAHPKLDKLDGFFEVAGKLLTKQPTFVFDEVTHNDEDFYVASVGLPELNWKVIAMLPKAEPLSKVQNALTQTAILNTFIVAVFIFLMVILAKKITKPILNIGERLLEMAGKGGDLTHTLDGKGNDELALLAKGFNAIITKVREIMVEIKINEKVMSDSFEQLRIMADQINNLALFALIVEDSN